MKKTSDGEILVWLVGVEKFFTPTLQSEAALRYYAHYNTSPH